MAINSVAIGSTDTELLPFNGVDNTVPTGEKWAITTIMVCNTWVPNPGHEEDGLTQFDMHFVKSGEPKGNPNKVINNLPLPAGETFTFDSEKVILEEGDRIVLLGESPTVLSATVSYLRVD
jgi:hypothetical protein